MRNAMSQSVLHEKLVAPDERKPHQEFLDEKKEIQNKKHYQLCSSFTEGLAVIFSHVSDACMGGDQAFYWNSEDDRDCVCPDAYLIRNTDNADRLSFKLWEEKAKHPDFRIAFVLEIWSKNNPMRERYEKYEIYRDLGATEYLEFDMATNEMNLFRLDEHGRYKVAEPSANGRRASKELNAEIVYEDGLIRLYQNNEKVLTASEAKEEIARLKNELAKSNAP